MLDIFNIFSKYPYLPTNAVFKTECSIPFLISVAFLWSNALCFCRNNIPTQSEVFLHNIHHPLWGSAVCISKCPTCLSKEQYPFQKSQCFYIICSMIDIEHPSQKRNMIETVSIIRECSFASYYRILSWIATQSSYEEAAFLETALLLFDMCTFPLISPAFIYFGLKRRLSLKEMFSILSCNDVFFESHISLISSGCCTKNNRFRTKEDQTLSKDFRTHAIHYICIYEYIYYNIYI